MRKSLFIFLLLPLISCSQEQKILLQDYSFLVTDGEVTKLHQSNDTLYELKCYIDQPCQTRPATHFKILSSNKTGGFVILKLERLDTIPLTTNPYPATRYSVLALKTTDSKKLSYLLLNLGLTKQQLDTVKTDIALLKDKFFFTFFSDSYLKDLSALKKVATKDEVMGIVETTKNEKYRTLVEKYSKTETSDLYASGLSAEILNLACIEKGYNPIGAGRAINKLTRKKP